MWAEACELLERAERLHRQFFRFGTSPARRPAWEPPVDIFETERDLSIVVALPGVMPEQVEVGIQGDTLVVMGERHLPRVAQGAVIHQLEIPHGRFERRIALPPARFEFDRQELAYGCLLLVLRKVR
jgi:HSP20 family molecular chaperone IbpA